MTRFKIYDNGGRTADRYTVVLGDSVFTMSPDASAPNGVNMYAGEVDEFAAGDFPVEQELGSTDNLPVSVCRAIVTRLEQGAEA